jgi:hypothetical protein
MAKMENPEWKKIFEENGNIKGRKPVAVYCLRPWDSLCHECFSILHKFKLKAQHNTAYKRKIFNNARLIRPDPQFWTCNDVMIVCAYTLSELWDVQDFF